MKQSYVARAIGGLTLLAMPLASFAGSWSPPDKPTIGLPESTISSIGDFYKAVCSVTQWVLVFGLILGVLFVIYGGVKYVTAGGDSSKEGDAKKTILGALIGVVFLVLAVGIVNIISSFFGSTGGGISLSNAACQGSLLGGFIGGAPTVPGGNPGGAPTLPTPDPGTGGNPPPPPPPPGP